LEVTPTCAVIEPGRSRNFKVTLSEPKVILGTGSFYLVVMCRPVGTLPSEAYNVWFETPYGRDTEIARKISVIKSLGYCAQEVSPIFSHSCVLQTVMDLPDQASAVFSYWYPTTTIDDSDTLTARNVESETLTAQMIDELDVCDDATNGAVMEGAGDGFQNSQITPKNTNVQRYAWIWKFVDVVFPPIGDSSEQISPPCGSS
uniref:REJ domain-containing protein n=1 Tax=Toxocara canis TaxID=6265 RepID=A0A183VC87_TOXCA